MKKILPFPKNHELYGHDAYNYDNKRPASWFTIASLFHFLFGIIAFMVCKIYFKINDLYAFLLVNIGHIIEDYLENTTKISIEGIYHKISNCKNKLFLAPTDNDTMQNFIGDNISCFLGTLLAYFLLKNNKFYNITEKFLIIYIIIFIASPSIFCNFWRERNITLNKV
jgi:hypothetical protein